MSSHRPIYIPRNKRKRLLDNTVYSVGKEDGWKPTEVIDATSSLNRQSLSARDIMDDRDFEEWGGASRVRQEFAAETTSSTERPKNEAILTDLFTITLPTRVGDKLLAKLGWKSTTGSTIVPAQDGTSTVADGDVSQLLSRKRLRRIQRQQQRVEIPIPKLDQAGLGFDPHKNAPEFQAYKERMLKRQRNRAPKNVYHVDSVLQQGDNGRGSGAITRHSVHDSEPDTATAASYPHMALQDFVGTQSAAGFALQDDDDEHVFDHDDDNGGGKGTNSNHHISAKIKLNADDYDMVAYEPDDSSSDDDDGFNNDSNKGSNKLSALSSLFGDALSSWAGAATDSTLAAPTVIAVTADGKPPLSGFVLGRSDKTFLEQTRFRGPEIPRNYQVKPHVFGPNESPLVLQALSHAAKLAATDQREEHVMDQARIVAPVKPITAGVATPVTKIFGGLSKTMSDRFTAASSDDVAPHEEKAVETQSAIQVKRTVQSFCPEPLLCKRFNVPVLSRTAMPIETSGGRTREEAFFQDHVMAKVAQDHSATTEVKKPSTTRVIERPCPDEDFEMDPLLSVKRPEMEVFKSIFAANSDDDLSLSSDEDNKERFLEKADVDAEILNNGRRSNDVPQMTVAISSSSNQELVTLQGIATVRHIQASDDDSSTDLSALSSPNVDKESKVSNKRRKKHSKLKKHKKKKKRK